MLCLKISVKNVRKIAKDVWVKITARFAMKDSHYNIKMIGQHLVKKSVPQVICRKKYKHMEKCTKFVMLVKITVKVAL